HYFLHDGHGSVRALLNSLGAFATIWNEQTQWEEPQVFHFDAYGNALGFDPSAALTNLLYSGELFDSRIGQQYLRARYYDPAAGRFNRLDPFAGNSQDPQSYHKYLYTHGDPVNGIDPTGLYALNGLMSGIGTRLRMAAQNVGSRLVAKRYALAKITLAQNALVTVIAGYNIAKNPIPDGYMVNFGYSGQTHGVGGGLVGSIYFDFATRKIHVFGGVEFGLAPVSAFARGRGRDYLRTSGFVWNVDHPSDLAGPSTTATLPIWLLRRNYRILNPTLPNYSSFHPWMTLIRQYEEGNSFEARSGVAQVSHSLGGDTVGVYYGRNSYTWAATMGFTRWLFEVADLNNIEPMIANAFGGVDNDFVGHVARFVALFKGQLP
ncbi:MAG: RHS repeat-associated core domain-containing protein, partial [Pirellulaceae bacterium]|nr:RHS repeat-associated core domain-containing protein [Pirellulaceae bacterium]